jgi:hypothetical protein
MKTETITATGMVATKDADVEIKAVEMETKHVDMDS